MNRIFHKHAPYVKGLLTRGKHLRLLSAKTSGENNVVSRTSDILPFTDIPLVKGYPVIGSLYEFVSSFDKLHELSARRLNEYGPIYREQLGFGSKSQQLFTANIDDWQHILRGENRGNPPGRPKLWSLEAYRKKRGLGKDMVSMTGEEFDRNKEGIKSLLMPRHVAKLVEPLSDVTDDLMNRLAASTTADGTIEDVRNIIHNWAFECGGFITFQTRLGMLTSDESNINEDVLNFYHSARSFFEGFYRMEMGFPHHRILPTKAWKEYERARDQNRKCSTDFYYKYGEHVTDKNTDLTEAERISHVGTVLVASSDTTAHTAIWTLIELSRNPEVQQKLYDEISKVTVYGQLTSSNLQLPYLRGFLKEVYRVRPLVLYLQRVLAEDLVLSGYQVPIGVTVNLMLGVYNQHEWFDDADKVKPERWYREREKTDSSSPAPHPFSVLPFGHGQRSCIGRRIAENELLIFITKVVQRFKISPMKEYGTKFRLFLIPDGEVTLKLEER